MNNPLNAVYAMHREQILERPTSQEIVGGEAKVQVDWRIADAADIDALPEETIQYTDYRKQLGKKMLLEGSVCLIGLVDGETAHVGWMTFDRISSPPFYLPLGPGWAYFHRTRTSPAFRGKGLQGAGIKKRLELARESGVIRAVNMVDTANAVSLHNYRKLGFVGREQIWILELLGKKIAEHIPKPLRALLSGDALQATE